jgi:GNAT superfamily N-acetyltransferase
MAASHIMTNFPEPSVQFVAKFAEHCPHIDLRAECEADQPFLVALFTACSLLANSLPQHMIEQQAWMQDQGYRVEFPAASRWIILRSGQPIGRIIIDWDIEGLSHCIDLALLPAEQGGGIGAALLQSWIATSDRLGRDCWLEVTVGNRARNLYNRLGFVAAGDPHQPNITMKRLAIS